MARERNGRNKVFVLAAIAFAGLVIVTILLVGSRAQDAYGETSAAVTANLTFYTRPDALKYCASPELFTAAGEEYGLWHCPDEAG